MYQGEHEGNYNPGIGWGEVGASGVPREMEEYHLLEEIAMLEEIIAMGGIGVREIPIFTSKSKGRGKERRDPVDIVLVKTRERIVKSKRKKIVLRNYRMHRDGDDRLDAIVRENLGQKADQFDEQGSLNWVEWIDQTRRRLRALTRSELDLKE